MFILFLGCKTNGGPVQNQPCVFPFIYKGENFSSCTEKKFEYVPWCATETDTEGKFIDDKWGYCEEGCPGGKN